MGVILTILIGYLRNLQDKVKKTSEELKKEKENLENQPIEKIKKEIESFGVVKKEHKKKTTEALQKYNQVTTFQTIEEYYFSLFFSLTTT